MPAGRSQRWINTHIISAVLDRVRDEDGEPLFTLKGGAAMELRLGLNARASKDYDAAFRARADEMLDALDRALADDWHGFQLQRTEPEPVRETSAVRMDVRLAYKGKAWGTVQLDVAPAEGDAGREIDRVPARPLDAVQIEGRSASRVSPCATRSPRRSTPAPRPTPTAARTIASATSSTCRSYANSSATVACPRSAPRAWRSSSCATSTPGPPAVTIWPSWADGFAAMAREVAFHTGDVEIAGDDLRAFIRDIDAA